MPFFNKVGVSERGLPIMRHISKNKYSPNDKMMRLERDKILADIPPWSYQCKCCHCSGLFIGKKDDVVCNNCALTPIKSSKGRMIINSIKRLIAGKK
jgi:hypothetical protein